MQKIIRIDGMSCGHCSARVEKALSAFSDTRVILLLGGSDKGTPLADFMEVVADRKSVV